MYAEHFGLHEKPFAITPDPGYLYLSAYHQEALAHLVYGADENGGFVQLTGEVGTGKTTLIRALLAQPMDDVSFALCLNPRLTVAEFLALILDELGVAYPRQEPSLKSLVDALNRHLLDTHAARRRTVLIVDEAQNLSRDVLEQVRLLTNLETHRHKLLRVILVGQPELRQMLARADLRQLAQRITVRYHLQALNRKETVAYVRHRLNVAGGRGEVFSRAALRAVYRWSDGIPRLINVVCDRALLGAYVRGRQRITARILNRAAREALHGNRTALAGAQPSRLTAAGLALVFAASALYPRSFPIEPASVTVEEAAQTALAPAPPAPGQAVAPPETASPAPEPVADLVALLADSAITDDAMSRLLRLWGENLAVPPGAYPCEWLKERGLRCLSGQGDWQTLRHYNRPAILRLVNENGASRHVLLRGLGEARALLDVGSAPVEVGLAELDPLWSGDFLLAWRPPTSHSLIGPGSQGEPVIWLRRQLALTQNQALQEPLSEKFDSGLRAQVERFQRNHDLQVDGLVGMQTMLLLNVLAPPPDTPLLVSAIDNV